MSHAQPNAPITDETGQVATRLAAQVGAKDTKRGSGDGGVVVQRSSCVQRGSGALRVRSRRHGRQDEPETGPVRAKRGGPVSGSCRGARGASGALLAERRHSV